MVFFRRIPVHPSVPAERYVYEEPLRGTLSGLRTNGIREREWIEPLPRTACRERPIVLVANPVNIPRTTSDDAHLLERVSRRDRQAFSQFYDRYSGVLYSTVLRVLNNP